ncbi:methyltransferase [Cellulomonas sp. ATA003]|uniref:methyltransferase n=1 Tax=Cellulomonas sp. ATA003 TaxID=3073064 RepID=UPI002873AAD7|nr:methyltransferase [Cellulomonas sp. ATA003]WNB86704.1 methyltransferase [Cellulomonas sp. ATA003]
MPAQTMTFGPLVVTFDERVLRPRPWTSLQAEWAAELDADLPSGPVLELCSGAGHIGQAAAVLTGRDLVQVDVDPHACALAEANAAANVADARVDVRCGDLAAMVEAHERFPLVLADPPYLPRDEVGDWPDDPALAVDGGPDGREILRRCLAVAGAHVQPGGAVLLQALGREQVEALAGDLDGAGLALVDLRAHDDRRAVALLRPVDVRHGTQVRDHGSASGERASSSQEGRAAAPVPCHSGAA